MGISFAPLIPKLSALAPNWTSVSDDERSITIEAATEPAFINATDGCSCLGCKEATRLLEAKMLAGTEQFLVGIKDMPAALQDFKFATMKAQWTITSTVIFEEATLPVGVPGSIEVYPQTLELDVTQADIDKGERRNSEGCAVARAAQRRFDGAEVQVGGDTVRVYEGGKVVATYLPEGAAMSNWIQRFDRDEKVKPARFALRRIS